MTIGEKIKYLRNQQEITQEKLGELSGINMISIARYEKDKTIPKPQQIEKLARALNVGYFAIGDFSGYIRLKTKGDLIGLIILLCKNNLISIKGERSISDDMISPDTAVIKINPIITQFFKVKNDNNNLNASNIAYFFNDNDILYDILKWEKRNYSLNRFKNSLIDDSTSNTIDTLNYLKNQIERYELELQQSTEFLKDLQ